MIIRENLFVVDFIVEARETCPAKGRHMGLPLPDIAICRYIRWEMPNNSASS